MITPTIASFSNLLGIRYRLHPNLALTALPKWVIFSPAATTSRAKDSSVYSVSWVGANRHSTGEEVVVAHVAVFGVDAAVVFDGLLTLKGLEAGIHVEEKA